MQDSAVLLLDVQLSHSNKIYWGADVPTFKSPRSLKPRHSFGIIRQNKKKTYFRSSMSQDPELCCSGFLLWKEALIVQMEEK